MAERSADPTYEKLLEQYPEGSEDPKVAEQLRKAREKVAVPKKEGYVIGYDGRVYSEDEYGAMSRAQRRGVCVGPTCIHYNTDVPGMSDTD